MAYNQYSGYGGNPYGGEQTQGGYGGNPYGQDDGNPYGGGAGYGQGLFQDNSQQPAQPPPVQQNQSYASAQSNYSQATPGAGQPGQPGQQRVEYIRPERSVMPNSDFLSRVEAVKADIRTLTTQVGSIASTHQRTLSSPESGSSQQLESLISQTQVLNTSIKDQIKTLEADAVRSKDNTIKNAQIQQLKSSFNKQLQEYRQEEASYEKRYREQIARQYRIVNPEATDSEVQEAAQADWGNEGVFQTALKSNRSATASTVLGAVRARHNDIQKIERTLMELNQLMEELATQVVLQDEPVQQVEQHTDNVKKDTEAGNTQLTKGIESARRARKLKWWCLAICVAIVVILALVLGLYFGLNKAATGGGGGN